ncbi:hypothetical protein ACQEU6_12325 [Spirillospora sp. CA-108201]
MIDRPPRRSPTSSCAVGPPLPPAYRDILAVLADHPGYLRTEDLALNLTATPR